MAAEHIILLGAPGAGKGTQAQNICDELNIPALSTGAIFRAAMEAGSEVGKKAKEYVEAGNLVPDDITVGIIADRILENDCSNGFILDGFPRTVAQAEALEKMLTEHNMSLTHVLSIEVDEEAIVQRRGGRLMAPTSGRVYHETNNPPKVAGKCDVSGEALIKRDDDKEEIVRHRLKVYEEQTAPVKGYYAANNMLTEVNGMQDVADVSAEIMRIIK